jgi:hypothetical protein
MASFVPRCKWSLDSGTIWLDFGDDYKVWRESYYPLRELKPNETTKSTVTIANYYSDMTSVRMSGQFLNAVRPAGKEHIHNRDIPNSKNFKGFYYNIKIFPPTNH